MQVLCYAKVWTLQLVLSVVCTLGTVQKPLSSLVTITCDAFYCSQYANVGGLGRHQEESENFFWQSEDRG